MRRSMHSIAAVIVAMLLGCVFHLSATAADEVLQRRTVELKADGKTVAHMMLPFDAPATVTWSANRTERGQDGTLRLSGNVQLSLRLNGVAPLTLLGDEMIVRGTPLDADEAQALRDLAAMGISDQSLRAKPVLTPDEWARQSAIDVANMRRLAAIVDRYGWPGTRFGGADNARNAFLVLQHADHQSQRKYLPLLRAAAARGDASNEQLALLEDRVLVRDGKPQLYGTQFKDADAKELAPVHDEAHLEQRRRAMGLPPLAEYMAGMREAYRTDTGRPAAK